MHVELKITLPLIRNQHFERTILILQLYNDPFSVVHFAETTNCTVRKICPHLQVRIPTHRQQSSQKLSSTVYILVTARKAELTPACILFDNCRLIFSVYIQARK